MSTQIATPLNIIEYCYIEIILNIIEGDVLCRRRSQHPGVRICRSEEPWTRVFDQRIVVCII